MKRYIVALFCTLAASVFVHNRTYAQAVGTASSTATIISAVGVDNASNMIFGNITVSSSSGSAVLSASPASVITVNGGASVVAASASSSSTAAAVNVSGSASSTYTASIMPSTVSLSDGRGNSVAVTPQLSSNVGILDSNGKSTLYVGATLTVSANQPNGSYGDNETYTVIYHFN